MLSVVNSFSLKQQIYSTTEYTEVTEKKQSNYSQRGHRGASLHREKIKQNQILSFTACALPLLTLCSLCEIAFALKQPMQ